MRVQTELRRAIETSIAPARLDIVDESHRHAGHAGSREAGETHFRVRIVAAAFEGKTQVARQRMVYAALDSLMRTDIHALQLQTLTPAEAGDLADG
ncbi:BolA family protein [Marinivivus vitaminiproducens]|uniref:BolA family protein n=1 Tax=Marinivivus vitaminiproducens TaxID=3035935 RepID=UPI0027A500FF|nr:BolA family transcriptional regulator [Geminicoccaceae bacterium SCSIO 64248]